MTFRSTTAASTPSRSSTLPDSLQSETSQVRTTFAQLVSRPICLGSSRRGGSTRAGLPSRPGLAGCTSCPMDRLSAIVDSSGVATTRAPDAQSDSVAACTVMSHRMAVSRTKLGTSTQVTFETVLPSFGIPKTDCVDTSTSMEHQFTIIAVSTWACFTRGTQWLEMNRDGFISGTMARLRTSADSPRWSRSTTDKHSARLTRGGESWSRRTVASSSRSGHRRSVVPIVATCARRAILVRRLAPRHRAPRAANVAATAQLPGNATPPRAVAGVPRLRVEALVAGGCQLQRADRRQGRVLPVPMCKRLCKANYAAPQLAPHTPFTTDRPPLPKLNVEGSSPFTRFDLRRCSVAVLPEAKNRSRSASISASESRSN